MNNHQSKLLKPFYIVSAYQATENININEANHGAILHWLADHGIEFVEVIGVYQGQAEKSFLVHNERLAEKLARKFNQECYFIGAKGYGYLKYSDKPFAESIGELRFSKTKPLAKGYTFFPKNEMFMYTE